MGIDASTGLPEGVPNRTPFLDRIRAVAEGAEMTLQTSIPLQKIMDILLLEANAKQLAEGKTVEIALGKIPSFNVNAFVEFLVNKGYEIIRDQADLIDQYMKKWADAQGLDYSSQDVHTVSSLRMYFKIKSAE